MARPYAEGSPSTVIDPAPPVTATMAGVSARNESPRPSTSRAAAPGWLPSTRLSWRRAERSNAPDGLTPR